MEFVGKGRLVVGGESSCLVYPEKKAPAGGRTTDKGFVYIKTINIHKYTHKYTNIHKHTKIYTNIQKCRRAQGPALGRVQAAFLYICVYLCIFVYICVFMCIFMYICVYLCIFAYILLQYLYCLRYIPIVRLCSVQPYGQAEQAAEAHVRAYFSSRAVRGY